MAKLKPCPFCGAKGKDLHIRRKMVVCFGCGAYGPDTLYEEGQQAVIDAWNKRS